MQIHMQGFYGHETGKVQTMAKGYIESKKKEKPKRRESIDSERYPEGLTRGVIQ